MLARKSSMSRLFVIFAAAVGSLAAAGDWAASAAPGSGEPHMSINCEYSTLCPDITDSARVFGEDEYVGHDEPSLLFYSNHPGSGNRTQYAITLPRDPTPSHPTQPGKSYNFELNGALWFGMALCDTQSYPEQVSGCTPDSDTNIVDPAVSPSVVARTFITQK